MRFLLEGLKTHWNRTDTVLCASNSVAFLAYLGNCGWESVWVVYGAALLPLAAQAALARGDKLLRRALAFGFLVGAAWPLGEWLVVTTLGWWGSYLAPGPRILYTPVYCCLIGWLASTYCYYVGGRWHEVRGSLLAWALASGSSAFMLGVIGENFFVAARMWEYDPSPLDWFSVPAFVPIACGIAYGNLPLAREWHVGFATAAFLTVTLVVSVGLGLATGFFPR